LILNLGKSNILRKEVNSADLQVPPSPRIKRGKNIERSSASWTRAMPSVMLRNSQVKV